MEIQKVCHPTYLQSITQHNFKVLHNTLQSTTKPSSKYYRERDGNPKGVVVLGDADGVTSVKAKEEISNSLHSNSIILPQSNSVKNKKTCST